MQNVFISSSTVTSGSLTKGGTGFGVVAQNYGPTTANTGFYNTITPSAGGYVFYKTKTQNGPIIKVASNDSGLINIVQKETGTTYSISGALQWAITQSNVAVTNFDYPNIVTSGLVFNVDAMSTLSCPQTSSNWYDISGGNLTGSAVGPLSYTKTGTSGSLLFNGSSTYYNFGNQNLGLDLISKSFCAWVKITSYPQNPTAIIDKDFDNGGSGYGGWAFWVQNNGKLWWWNTANQDILDNGPASITANTWTHVALTYNSSTKTATFYINGTQNSSLSNSLISEQSSGTQVLAIGAARIGNANVGGYISGSVANVLAYNRVLTTAEVVTNYSASKPLFGL